MKINPNKLKAAVFAREKSLCDFARKIGLPSGVLANALRNGNVSSNVIRRFAIGLGVSVESFLKGVSYD